jgi:levanase
MTSPVPARRRITRYEWLDWGRDYYAAVSFAGSPTAVG